MSGPGDSAESKLPRIVIVGGGFGGLACAFRLGNKAARVTVVDRRNFHLFVPLLYQVATAVLSPADIAQPIRGILRRFRNIDVVMAEVAGVDFAGKRVLLREGAALPYDRLVLAAGSEYSYFGHSDWPVHAPGLKTIEDAQEIRSQLLRAFERAETSRDPAEQQALITTIIVGGGPTGVEMAGSVAELHRHALARDFRHVQPQSSRIVLVEAGPRLLASFPESLAAYAQERLVRLGVTIWTGRAVEEIAPGRVKIAGEWVDAGTIVWAAGIQASPAASWIAGERDRSGRIVVAPDLSVPGLDGVFAIGDLAHCAGTGRRAPPRPCPGRQPAGQASRQASHREHRRRHAGAALRLP